MACPLHDLSSSSYSITKLGPCGLSWTRKILDRGSVDYGLFWTWTGLAVAWNGNFANLEIWKFFSFKIFKISKFSFCSGILKFYKFQNFQIFSRFQILQNFKIFKFFKKRKFSKFKCFRIRNFKNVQNFRDSRIFKIPTFSMFSKIYSNFKTRNFIIFGISKFSIQKFSKFNNF
jgi:hypothetical protein